MLAHYCGSTALAMLVSGNFAAKTGVSTYIGIMSRARACLVAAHTRLAKRRSTVGLAALGPGVAELLAEAVAPSVRTVDRVTEFHPVGE